jgi:putative ABC transport system substrate-binding protein
MRRRDFIAGLGGAAAWPLAAWAQQAVPVIGWIGTGSPSLFHFKARFGAFQLGLKEAGYVEGRNVAIEFRWAEGKFDRFPTLLADMVARRVNVIAAMAGTPLAQAAKAATTTIPIVFYVGVDPVRTGLVASLDRPGGNLTGVTTLSADVAPKRLELLRDLLPALRRVALLVNPASPANVQVLTADTQAAARTLGIDLVVLKAGSDPELDAVFANWQQTRAEALVIGTDSFFSNRTLELGRLVLRHGVPAVFEYPEFAASGGLMSYGTDIVDQFRQAGILTGRILNGEKPADLPVQQTTKVELVINLKTAKALGITVPLMLLGRADEVIE